MSLIIDPYRFGSATFDPSLITWYAAWWASDPLWSNPGDGNLVSSWRDLSGNARDVTQGNSTYQPTYRASYASLNNQPAVEFGTTQYIATGNLTEGTAKTVVAIARTSSVAAARWAVSANDGNTALLINRSAGTTKPTAYSGSFLNSTVTMDTNAHALYAYFNGASSYIAVDATKTTGNSGGSGHLGTTPVSLGNPVGGSAGINGALAFVGVYLGDIEAAANWAAFKAGITATYGLSL